MIKKIFVSGGSQCIAGGFIWDKEKKIYSDKGIIIKHNLDVAYPKILADKLGVELINEGAPGGSITRMIRKTYEFLFNETNKNEVLIILEVPPGWRDEYYSTEYKRYFNVTIGNILSPNDTTDVASGNNPNDYKNIYKNVTNHFFNFIDDKLHLEKMMLNLLGLISYLKLNNIQHIIIDTGDFDTYLTRRKQSRNYNFVWFSDKFEYPMWQWINENKLLIKDETNGLSNDEHMGIEGNKQVAEKLYKIIINEKD